MSNPMLTFDDGIYLLEQLMAESIVADLKDGVGVGAMYERLTAVSEDSSDYRAERAVLLGNA